MQVFTTIFLAETHRADTDGAEDTELDQVRFGPVEFGHLRERITMLETCNWLGDEGPNDSE